MLKKSSALVVGNEANFISGQQVLSAQKHASIVINLNTTTFKVMGELSGAPVNSLINICQEVLLSLSFFTPYFERKTHFDEPTNEPKQSSNSKQLQLVEKTCSYLLENLDQPLTINTICKAMHSNRNSLSFAFKQALNIGVSSWLRQQRMSRARQLLVNTDLSIQEISSRVGYPDQANFSTTFKSQFNQSPMQTRRSLNPESLSLESSTE